MKDFIAYAWPYFLWMVLVIAVANLITRDLWPRLLWEAMGAFIGLPILVWRSATRP